MTDDLVKRLREYRVGCGLHCEAHDAQEPLSECIEAADRIEKLELIEKAYEQNQQTWSRNIAHIEKLEAALRRILDNDRNLHKSLEELFAEFCIEARKALEGKDD